ncbi:MAG: DUF2029 domain-containing protein [Sphingobacteriales bacterium]|nr:MAG: DUF2029 domain-containing protein [Sphingobacteriales bacterium]
MMKIPKPVFTQSLLSEKKWAFICWFGLSAVALVKVLVQHSNNYLIYKNTFFNLIQQQNLFAPYPNLYADSNHYGPIFGVLIAPFALLPDALGTSLWVILNASILLYAVFQLNISQQNKLIVCFICAHELMTASYSTQFNPAMAALILLSFTFTEKRNEPWAAFCIVLGTFIKLYGIVGLAFFFFVKNKPKFILWLAIWALVMFALPMLFSSPQFVLNTYSNWYFSLIEKDSLNATSTMQDISVMGMIRRIFKIPQLANISVLLPVLLLFASAYLNIKSYKALHFRLLILASTLLFTVIFSSGSESPTYIIAFIGLALWFVLQAKPVSIFNWILLILAIIISSLSPSDLFPKYIQINYIKPYALKALPCFLIWLKIIYETWVYKPHKISV